MDMKISTFNTILSWVTIAEAIGIWALVATLWLR